MNDYNLLKQIINMIRYYLWLQGLLALKYDFIVLL